MAWALVSTRHPSLPWICKHLLAIYLEIQLNSCTTYLNIKDFRGSKSLTQPKKGGVGVGDDNKAGRDGSVVDKSEVDGGEVEDHEVRKKV